MGYLDELAILGGLLTFAGGSLRNYIMIGAGFGLAMASVVTDTFVANDEFYELRRKSQRRERGYNKTRNLAKSITDYSHDVNFIV